MDPDGDVDHVQLPSMMRNGIRPYTSEASKYRDLQPSVEVSTEGENLSGQSLTEGFP